jgi:NAD(P)-dependent dehydrogenase (short-subunit alcohol dehydrogenase family)
LSNFSDLEEALNNALRKLPPVRYVIYNAKSSPVGNFTNVSPAEFADALTLNVAGAYAVIQIAQRWTPTDLEIVLTGGGFKDRPDANRLALSVSKAGMHTLSVGMNSALVGTRIRIKTLVLDGAVRRGGSSLLSCSVADAIANLALSPSKRVAHYDLGSQIRIDHPQLTLFGLEVE